MSLLPFPYILRASVFFSLPIFVSWNSLPSCLQVKSLCVFQDVAYTSLPWPWFSPQTFWVPSLYMVCRALTFSCCKTWDYLGAKGKKEGLRMYVHVGAKNKTVTLTYLSFLVKHSKEVFFCFYLFYSSFNFPITPSRICPAAEWGSRQLDRHKAGGEWSRETARVNLILASSN